MKLVIRHRGRDRVVHIERDGSHARVELDGEAVELDIRSLDETTRSILCEGRHHDLSVRPLGSDRFEVAGAYGSEALEAFEPLALLAATAHDAQAVSAGERIDAYMPGRVVAVLVEEGETVAAGTGVLVLEAMKMENEIQSERAGKIRKLYVAAGEAVEGGDPLYEIE